MQKLGFHSKLLWKTEKTWNVFQTFEESDVNWVCIPDYLN